MDYTLESFFKQYMEQGCTGSYKEAFYAGAQTVFYMLINSIQNDKPNLIQQVQNELDAFRISKEIEANEPVFN